METLTTGMLIVLGISGAITALAMLRVFANIIEHETELHDLRIRVRELSYEHELYLARLKGDIGDESAKSSAPGNEHNPIQAIEQAMVASEDVLESIDADIPSPQAA